MELEWWEIAIAVVLALPIVALWLTCAIDAVMRPDLGIVTKSLWVVVVLFVPLFGVLTYLLARPVNPGQSWPGKAF